MINFQAIRPTFLACVVALAPSTGLAGWVNDVSLADVNSLQGNWQWRKNISLSISGLQAKATFSNGAVRTGEFVAVDARPRFKKFKATDEKDRQFIVRLEKTNVSFSLNGGRNTKCTR